MYDPRFQKLVESGYPSGEVVAVDDFIVRVRGLGEVGSEALVLFDTGAQGIVHAVDDREVLIFSLSSQPIKIGAYVAVQSEEIITGVGDELLGRVVSATGLPLDGKGPIRLTKTRPVFAEAPPIIERGIVDEQLASGITVIDTLFPIVCGQRIAILGNSKSGKTTAMLQLAAMQQQTERIVIYVMIAKRQTDIDQAVSSLRRNGVIGRTVVLATNVFDSLVESYLAPYVACAIAEEFWNNGQDVIVIYDDLMTHAQVLREISLLAGESPGRNSYPGSMFYAHSSLLERAGKLKSNNATLTAIPLVLTPNDDITAYLPTNIISITDGQIIFDLEEFRKGMKPAVNTGLSVSRVGGRAQSQHYKEVAGNVLKQLADYRQAADFSRFASEMAIESQQDLVRGERLLEALKQDPDQTLTPLAQQVLLDVVLSLGHEATFDVAGLKTELSQNPPETESDRQYEKYVKSMQEKFLIQLAKTSGEVAGEQQPSSDNPPAHEDKS